MKPIHSFLFFIYVCLMLLVLTSFFPSDGFFISENYKIEFPTLAEFLDVTEEISLHKKVKNLTIKKVSKEDSIRLAFVADSIKKANLLLQFPNKNKSILHAVFKEMEIASATGNTFRIAHYGDSQIEGDRITAYVRNSLQKKFGGTGTGIFSIIEIAPRLAVKAEYSDNWIRYPGFGKKDTTVKHNHYGAIMSFCRFKPIDLTDTSFTVATYTFNKSKAAYGNARTFSKLKLFYGFNTKPVKVEITADGNSLYSQVLQPIENITAAEFNFSVVPEQLTLTFSGKDSPNIYGISLEGNKGIIMDNIGMRGASGTDFSKQNSRTLKAMYDKLNIKLLILQYGGNVMPYIKDEKGAENYGKWFESQLYFLKKHIPNVAIIVIGPSDMSVKEKDKYVTYPHLETVRDALKIATFNAGAAYWDMYEAMGGKNSMPKWVNANPPLAAPDYTHFSPSGTTKISEMFYDAFIKEYEAYKLNSAKK